MSERVLTRRRFLFAALMAAPFVAAGDARWLEPEWVKVSRVRLTRGTAGHRILQVSDIHHKGNHRYLASIIKQINALAPDFVCFTGDLIEEGKHLPEALALMSGIKSPMYGVPGNHDYWSKVPFTGISQCFAASGGAWLLDETVVTADGKFAITGASFFTFKKQPLRVDPRCRNIFLMHYPAWIEKLAGKTFDLVLAGHSHGGQVRLPFYGPLMVPFGVGRYDLGLFRTDSGPLYVSSGIGWYPLPIRFNCRPEITVFEV
jgi:hypothetical protein